MKIFSPKNVADIAGKKMTAIGNKRQCNAHTTEKPIAMLSKLIFKVFFT